MGEVTAEEFMRLDHFPGMRHYSQGEDLYEYHLPTPHMACVEGGAPPLMPQ